MTKNNSKPIRIFAAVMLWTGFMHAQESVNSSGGDGAGSGGSIAYSVGQVVYTTNTGSSGSVAQGVQHAFEIFTVGIKETNLNIALMAFPNPATESLTLQIKDYSNDKLYIQLYDMQGKLVYTDNISDSKTLINTSNLPASAYYLDVLNQDNKKIQSFKIIKN